MKNILVAIELKSNEKALLEASQVLVKALGAKVWLLHVADPDPEFLGYQVGPQYIRDAVAEEFKQEHRQLDTLCKVFREEGIDCEGLMIQGVTTEMILSEAKKLQIDLIMAGKIDQGLMHRLLMGSVTKGVIKEAEVPVMLVPLA